MAQIDFTDLQNEVMDQWDEEGTTYFSTENNGFDSPDPLHYETTLSSAFLDILNDPMACLTELGFNSISQYIRSKKSC